MLKKLLCVCSFFGITLLLMFIDEISGHGMMLDPVSRSSRWRYNKSAPINYDDNGLFCGGFTVQWERNDGKCGLCGDGFDDARPRANELGGKYGQGVIVKAYPRSQIVKLGIKITTNHLGFFYFHICNLDKFKAESELCFNENKIRFADGSLQMYIGKESGMIYPRIVLPEGLNCKHCVLRWNYQAGNNWGPCGNGTFAVGCGPQENFKGCSDITITRKSSKIRSKYSKKKKSNRIFNTKRRNHKKPHEKKLKWKNYVDDLLYEFENEADPLYEEETYKDVDNILANGSKEKGKFYEENISNFLDFDLFDSNEVKETVSAHVDEDQLGKKIQPVLCGFESEELDYNEIDSIF